MRDARAVVIREAVAADLDAIHAIEVASFANPWRREGFRNFLLGGAGILLVAVGAVGVEGFAAAIHAADEAELANLAVTPAARRRGVARALLRAVTDRVVATGARAMFLEVRASNVAARALYIAEGFREVAIRAQYYDHPAEDAVVMRKTVDAAA